MVLEVVVVVEEVDLVQAQDNSLLWSLELTVLSAGLHASNQATTITRLWSTSSRGCSQSRQLRRPGEHALCWMDPSQLTPQPRSTTTRGTWPSSSPSHSLSMRLIQCSQSSIQTTLVAGQICSLTQYLQWSGAPWYWQRGLTTINDIIESD